MRHRKTALSHVQLYELHPMLSDIDFDFAS